MRPAGRARLERVRPPIPAWKEIVVRRTPRYLSLLLVLCSAAAGAAETPPGMVWIPAAEFVMGTDDKKLPANERPAHRVKLDGFWMDEHAVTNGQFRKFV